MSGVVVYTTVSVRIGVERFKELITENPEEN